MEIVEKKHVFNNGFITYIKQDYKDYLNKLLSYTAKQEEGLEYGISERVKEFGSGLLEYLITHETNEDYEEDIDEVRKEKLEVMLYDIDNYLMSLEPFEAVQKFMNSNIGSLITEAQIYSNNLRKKIVDNILRVREIGLDEYTDEADKLMSEVLDNEYYRNDAISSFINENLVDVAHEEFKNADFEIDDWY